MKYRDARLLSEGDKVTRKVDGASLLIKEVECFGQYKTVKLVCNTDDGLRVIIFNEELNNV